MILNQPPSPAHVADSSGVAGRIGIFDSGVGGATVLRQLHDLLPNEDLLYLADQARCPYGARPTAEAYRAVIDEFFNDALYVAKYLWRDDLLPAKYSLDNIMKLECLRAYLQKAQRLDRPAAAFTNRKDLA
jgi:hypothetical protein